MARMVVRDGYGYTTIHRGRADCSCSGGGGFNLVGLPGDSTSLRRTLSPPTNRHGSLSLSLFLSVGLVLARPEFRIPCVNTHPFVALGRRLS